MTGGQGALALAEAGEPAGAHAHARTQRAPLRLSVPLPVPVATPEEIAAHEIMLAVIAKASGGRLLWAALEPPATIPAVAPPEDAPQRSSA
jgi:DNA polymerase III subunit epsilon